MAIRYVKKLSLVNIISRAVFVIFFLFVAYHAFNNNYLLFSLFFLFTSIFIGCFFISDIDYTLSIDFNGIMISNKFVKYYNNNQISWSQIKDIWIKKEIAGFAKEVTNLNIHYIHNSKSKIYKVPLSHFKKKSTAQIKKEIQQFLYKIGKTKLFKDFKDVNIPILGGYNKSLIWILVLLYLFPLFSILFFRSTEQLFKYPVSFFLLLFLGYSIYGTAKNKQKGVWLGVIGLVVYFIYMGVILYLLQ